MSGVGQDPQRPRSIRIFEVEWEGNFYAVESPQELTAFLTGITSINPSERVSVSTKHVLDEAFLRYPAIPFDRFVG